MTPASRARMSRHGRPEGRIPETKWKGGLVSTLALCAPLALLAACAAPEKPKPPPVAKVVQAPGKAIVAVDETQDGATVTLATAQRLRVELPTDGYAVNANLGWRMVLSTPGVLDDLGSKFERGLRDNNPSEAGGTTVWQLQPKGPGQVTLSFELRKPYSLDPPTLTLHYDVTVK